MQLEKNIITEIRSKEKEIQVEIKIANFYDDHPYHEECLCPKTDKKKECYWLKFEDTNGSKKSMLQTMFGCAVLNKGWIKYFDFTKVFREGPIFKREGNEVIQQRPLEFFPKEFIRQNLGL